ncbi:MAG TPA: aminoglycoside phosphotransferase family protein, partial [Actinopolymorphaceae bacterium]|nr:aminoglycoside phosphotransferase family protein [Actinopolymorphaceae bacterium]
PRDADHAAGLVDKLSAFLVRLHQTREEDLTSTVVPLTKWKRGAIGTVSRAVDHLAAELPAGVHRRLAAWREEFAGHVDGLATEEAVVVHGDFWHDNILTCDGEVTGVVDWEAAAVADPAVDLAPVWDIDENLGARLLDGYQQRAGPDASLHDRIRLFRIARNVGGITWSLDNDDPGEYADSLTKVDDVLHLT